MNYFALQQTVVKLLTHFGTTCKIATIDGLSLNAKIVFLPAEKKEDNSYVITQEKIAYINDTKTAPKPGDQVTVLKETLVITNVEKFAPAGVPNLYYKLILQS